jgi:hypothetical protein
VAENRVQRRLAAILAADVVGYRPPAPQTIVPHRGDMPFAMGGAKGNRRSPDISNGLNKRLVLSVGAGQLRIGCTLDNFEYLDQLIQEVEPLNLANRQAR